uniref:Uncharacterized protein n=1 Tax=Opuntia streptacantha TaxID=393608 RepID=A0A7C8Z5V5_OPUST
MWNILSTRTMKSLAMGQHLPLRCMIFLVLLTNLNEGVLFRRSEAYRLPTTKDDTELGMDVNLANKRQKHSRNAAIDLPANEQNIMHDACFQKSFCLNVSKSVVASNDTITHKFI